MSSSKNILLLTFLPSTVLSMNSSSGVKALDSVIALNTDVRIKKRPSFLRPSFVGVDVNDTATRLENAFIPLKI